MARQPDNSSVPYGSSEERGVLDEALEPEQVRALNSALRLLSDSSGVSDELQETAKRLLSGRLALRDVLDDPAAAHALGADMASLRGQWEALPEEVRRGEALGMDGGSPDSDSSSVPSSGASPSGRTESEAASSIGRQSRKKGSGRHSGGFSLY